MDDGIRNATFDADAGRVNSTAMRTPSNGLFDFDGRIGRMPYFWILLVTSIISSPLPYLAKLDKGERFGFFFFVAMILLLAVLFVVVAAAVKRCHDLGKSGWVTWLSVVPLVNFVLGLYLLFAKGMSGSNMYGPSPTTNAEESSDQPWPSKDASVVYSSVINSGGNRTSEPQSTEHIGITPKVQYLGFDEDAAYLQISNELESKTVDKGLWLRAMVQSGADGERQQTITFTTLRLKQLREEFSQSINSAASINEALTVKPRESIDEPRATDISDTSTTETTATQGGSTTKTIHPFLVVVLIFTALILCQMFFGE